MSTPQTGQRPNNPYLTALFTIGGLLTPISAIVILLCLGAVDIESSRDAANAAIAVCSGLFVLGVLSLLLGALGGAITWQSRRNAMLTFQEIRGAAVVARERATQAPVTTDRD